VDRAGQRQGQVPARVQAREREAGQGQGEAARARDKGPPAGPAAPQVQLAQAPVSRLMRFDPSKLSGAAAGSRLLAPAALASPASPAAAALTPLAQLAELAQLSQLTNLMQLAEQAQQVQREAQQRAAGAQPTQLVHSLLPRSAAPMLMPTTAWPQPQQPQQRTEQHPTHDPQQPQEQPQPPPSQQQQQQQQHPQQHQPQPQQPQPQQQQPQRAPEKAQQPRQKRSQPRHPQRGGPEQPRSLTPDTRRAPGRLATARTESDEEESKKEEDKAQARQRLRRRTPEHKDRPATLSDARGQPKSKAEIGPDAKDYQRRVIYARNDILALWASCNNAERPHAV
jgi:hypothetical protein